MAEQTKRKVIEIYLQLVKGSRSPVRAQVGNEKLATGTQAKRTLNILQLNVQGIRNKQLELAKLLHDHGVHRALLQETILTEDNQYTISGYMMTTRCICKKYRGVATLIRNDVQAEVINTTRETDEEKHTDTQCIHVWPDSGKKYIIHNIYNPPSCKLNVEQDLPTHVITQSTQDTSTGTHHCGDTPTTMPQDTSLKTCSQQVISYHFTTRQRLPHCITDPLVRRAHQT